MSATLTPIFMANLEGTQGPVQSQNPYRAAAIASEQRSSYGEFLCYADIMFDSSAARPRGALSDRLKHEICPPTHDATIGGRAKAFGSAKGKFSALVKDCCRMRDPGSSVATFINPAYRQIIEMGWEAVPFLLSEVNQQSGHWFTALAQITGSNPVTNQMRGNLRSIRRAWICWGIENEQLIARHGEGRLV
jgi:hypothetical protein